MNKNEYALAIVIVIPTIIFVIEIIPSIEKFHCGLIKLKEKDIGKCQPPKYRIVTNNEETNKFK